VRRFFDRIGRGRDARPLSERRRASLPGRLDGRRPLSGHRLVPRIRRPRRTAWRGRAGL